MLWQKKKILHSIINTFINILISTHKSISHSSITTSNPLGCMPRKYQHLIFDLDHTLWDFETASNETLEELYFKYHLGVQNIDLEAFKSNFHRVNYILWKKYNINEITSEQLRKSRFIEILASFGIDNEKLADNLSDEYLEICPTKPHLLPFAKEVLDELHLKYPLHILTNGFPDIQRTKMTSGGILHYFSNIITSAESGCKKPEKQAFLYLTQILGVSPENCLMIGDSADADIAGATLAGIDTVWYNPQKSTSSVRPTYDIECLRELSFLYENSTTSITL
jgi:YjjG family noncanonical pyrimidine nucleotidase